MTFRAPWDVSCGHFSNAALGRYRAFVTDHKRTVAIQTRRGIVVVSPDQPQAFVDALASFARPGAQLRYSHRT